MADEPYNAAIAKPSDSAPVAPVALSGGGLPSVTIEELLNFDSFEADVFGEPEDR